MCDHGDTILVGVKISADLSHSGEAYWKRTKIDRCIAPLVNALQEAQIDMRGSCCGHGQGIGDIHLQDGRLLLILPPDASDAWMAMGAAERPDILGALRP